MSSNMSSGMMGSNMSSMRSGDMMRTSDMMRCNYDNYMRMRYLNSFNRIMPFMERTLMMRDGGNRFFMGNDMMWCDMMMYCCMEMMMMENQSMMNQYSKLMALYQRIAQHPKICSYLKSRCMTPW